MEYCLWPCSLAVPVLAGWVYAFCSSYVQEISKTQPAVVLVLKRFRRRGNGLKSHRTDWGEAGNRTCDPWFTRHRFIPYTTATNGILRPV